MTTEIDYVSRAPNADFYYVHLENGEILAYIPPQATDIPDGGPLCGGGAVTFQQAMGLGLLFHGRRQAQLQAQLVWMEWVTDPSSGPCPAYVVRDDKGAILVVRGYEAVTS